jgi:dihydroorotase
MCEFAYAPFGISILETALGSLMGLVHEGAIDIELLISKLTWEPARVLGSKYRKLGSLAVGNSADLVLIDPDREWVVDPQTFASKGKNTPLRGVKFKGKVMATFYQGKTVYKDDLSSSPLP